MKPVTLEQLQLAVTARGYRWFDSGDFNLNLIGIRASDLQSNAFNDLICVAFMQAGQWILLQFDATTDPGIYYRENPADEQGTGFLVEGQHTGAFRIGMHKGYKALVQARALSVYRDDDRDAVLEADASKIDHGWHGCNMHRASEHRESVQVDRWSAMCQVIADPLEFDLLMSVVDLAADQWGNHFTYTLLSERDLPGV